MRYLTVFAAGLALILASAGTASAAPVITDAFSGTIVNGSTTPEDFSIGMDIITTSSIGISEVGIFDDFGDGLTSAHTVSIYTDLHAGNLIYRFDTLPGEGEYRNGYRYFTLPSSVSIEANSAFSVVVYYGEGNLDSAGDTFAGDGAPIFDDMAGLTAVSTGRFHPGDVFPFIEQGPADRYHVASFTYSPNPEPGTMALVSGLLVAAGVYRRRRLKARA